MAAGNRRRQASGSRAGKSASRKKNPNQGFPRGAKHPSAQLTADVVRQLRAGKFDKRPYAELAEKWGVSAAAISLARTGKTWTWLPGAKKPMKPTDPKRSRRRPAGTRAKKRSSR
jgi:hypothetical protein